MTAAALRRDLARVAKRMQQAADDAALDEARTIRDDEKRRVPKGDPADGHLRDAIEAHPAGDGAAEVRIDEPDRYYGVFVERGTSSMPAQPFVRPAYEAARRRWPKTLAKVLNDAIGGG